MILVELVEPKSVEKRIDMRHDNTTRKSYQSGYDETEKRKRETCQSPDLIGR